MLKTESHQNFRGKNYLAGTGGGGGSGPDVPGCTLAESVGTSEVDEEATVPPPLW